MFPHGSYPVDGAGASLFDSAGCSSKEINAVLGYTNRSTVSKSRGIMVPLYSVFFRSHLEYCVQFLASQTQEARVCPGEDAKDDERSINQASPIRNDGESWICLA